MPSSSRLLDISPSRLKSATHADLWHGFGPPEAWGRTSRILDDWCARVGRDPGAIERTAYINEEWRQPPITDMRDHSETLAAYLTTGATHILYGLATPFDVTPVEQLLVWRDQFSS